LKDISFPQPLTSVMFRHRLDADHTAGHEDLLLGFAGHVERIPFEFWSRSMPQKHDTKNDSNECLEVEPVRTDRGLARLGASDDIHDHSVYLHARHRNRSVQQSLLNRRGVGITGAAFVVLFVTRLRRRTSINPPSTPAQYTAQRRLEQGGLMDFRGEPFTEVGVLSGAVANTTVLNIKEQPSAEPVVEHRLCETLGMSNFSNVTRMRPSYYDMEVSPNALVDAPRNQGIRGMAYESVARVTSIGIRHLNGHGAESVEQQPPDALDTAVAAQATACPSSPTLEKPSPSSPQFHASRTAARSRTLSRKPSGLSISTVKSGINIGNERWKNLQIARGVPMIDHSQKPRAQVSANTADDAARMLLDRREIVEAPEEPETNFLKSLFTKKTTWLYCPPDGEVYEEKREAVDKAIRQKRNQRTSWTPNGRFVCSERLPPKRAAPELTLAPLPHETFLQQPCLTRNEVTEQKLIASALSGPTPPVADLSVHSKEAWKREQKPRTNTWSRTRRASSARGQPVIRGRPPLPLSSR